MNLVSHTLFAQVPSIGFWHYSSKNLNPFLAHRALLASILKMNLQPHVTRAPLRLFFAMCMLISLLMSSLFTFLGMTSCCTITQPSPSYDASLNIKVYIVMSWDQIYELVASKYVLGIVFSCVTSSIYLSQRLFFLIRFADPCVMLL